MATKNLARTAIEGGRCGHYKGEVSMLARTERAAERTYLRVVQNDPEAADDLVDPRRAPAYPCFADKLSPVRRFLDSRVGKSWNKTLAMIAERFDVRTTPGRHIVNDHILRDVATSPGQAENRFSFHRYYVDKHGILRKPEERVRARRKPEPPSPSEAAICAWLGNRKVGRMGARFVWFVPTRHPESVKVVYDQYRFVYAELDAQGNVIRVPIEYPNGRSFWSPKDTVKFSTIPFRQARLLEPKDEEFLLSLSSHLFDRVLSAAPANNPPSGTRIFRS